MQRVFAAEFAVFFHFNSVGIVLLVFFGTVIALLAFRASQSDFYSHFRHLLILIVRLPQRLRLFRAKNKALLRGTNIISHFCGLVNKFFKFFELISVFLREMIIVGSIPLDLIFLASKPFNVESPYDTRIARLLSLSKVLTAQGLSSSM